MTDLRELLRERDRLWCDAIIQTQDASSGRLVCDVEKLLHYFNSRAALAQPEERVGAARIWVKPQDMLTFKRDSDMVACRIVLAAPPAGEGKP